MDVGYKNTDLYRYTDDKKSSPLEKVFYLMRSRNSFSLKIFIPRVAAFSYFEHGSDPAKQKSVFLLTDSEISPPAKRIFSLASPRDRLAKLD